jgi:hypothetical protein
VQESVGTWLLGLCRSGLSVLTLGGGTLTECRVFESVQNSAMECSDFGGCSDYAECEEVSCCV